MGSETIARSREGAVFIAGRAVGALVLALPVVAYAVIPQCMTWASFELPAGVRWFGFVVGCLTIPAASWVLRSLGKNVSETVLTKRDHELVTEGPYQWVRHPLYTTGITLFLALGLMEASWLVLSAAAVAAVLVQVLVMPAEERALVGKFGDRYRAYANRTGRWLPRLPRSREA